MRIALSGLLVSLALFLVFVASPVRALESNAYRSEALTARLIVAEAGIAPGSRFLSAGLKIELEEGWKAYWRSPGEVGLPPEIDWEESTNLEDVEILWPAPTRFRAFGIENFGYAKQVTFPLQLQLVNSDRSAELKAIVNLLICSNVCVPERFELTLPVPLGSGVDAKAATEIAIWAARVPVAGTESAIAISGAALKQGQALVIQMTRPSGWNNPDVFPEFGAGTVFGAPDIRLTDDRTGLWASFPILALSEEQSSLRITVVDEDVAVTFDDVNTTDLAPSPPYVSETSQDNVKFFLIILLSFLGGLILNIMPCVLPVLSIKFASALRNEDRSVSQLRAGFLATAGGTVAFMWVLAFSIITLQTLGYAVGWGMQFQNAYFLIALILVVGLFSANLFGIFEVSLPSSWMARLSGRFGRGYVEDFSTGALTAVLATPCSAPLLGTAIAFALSGTAGDILAVFTAMGIGLALPYILTAVWPGFLSRLPKPGPWMMSLKIVLGLLLAGTVVWLCWVLIGVTSPTLTGLVLLGLGLIVPTARAYQVQPRRGLLWGMTAILGMTLAAPALLPNRPADATNSSASYWVEFDRSRIAREVSQGKTVFVDVTADWCITCKANKTLVLDREPVFGALGGEGVIAMRADWTRPDATVQSYLEAHGRYAIPFNIVYGPDAPEGIILSELLSVDAVLEALSTANLSAVPKR
ncbi:suppressor for copper-sensitivity B [Pseudosulfitobacter pseudonitzschiae]|uniref:Suppressor for copper-sensitivity B n=1 Tax=Pseudosulfitobacter pseudonitzschiae TaxID=1402135 RepID=A0A073J9U3_9RHOB|nr:protein-disulfide reductase DsbD domain-containing protein [Pseudosulfitobacter pseudonitzschiae]KEJ94487.1 suppressor for copper-sensitivity B [Pseudosulfitobacter pseudonitzschiae]QKS10855.1 thioredoxin family protein [Pseudosulfitobacter pseudonitzschiae]SHG11426.1 suppressor for copper-sensitivity B [Pseudosulfitobacter pseudonitzschiae]